MPIVRSFRKVPLEDIEEYYLNDSPPSVLDRLEEVLEDYIKIDPPNLPQKQSSYWNKFLKLFRRGE